MITGTVSPAPGADTAVVVAITNSAGTLADIAEVYPNASTGSFGYTSHPGGNPAWTSGTFTVNATWGGDSSTATQVVTFTYTAAEASTSSSTSASSSSSSASSSTSTASSSSSSSVSAAKATSSSSTTSTTSTTSAPEFPPSALAWVALAGAAFVAFASRRFRASTGRRAFETP